MFPRRTLLAAVLAFPTTGAALAQLMSQAITPAASTLNSGDTAWMLTSTALVLMMTIPGLALFYGGMVRKMNVFATVMQSFAVACLVTVLWTLVGYSFAFTPGSSLLGGGSASCCSG
jgi:Amt family ammonium transporter